MHIDSLDLNLLRVFHAVMERRSVSAAATALGMTQPGASLSLKRLRAHFDDELFVRQGTAMVPTKLADRLRDPVNRAMAIVHDEIGQATPFDPTTTRHDFVISLSDLGDLVFLPALVARLRAQAPHVTIRSVPTRLPALFGGLSDGSIDLALGHLIDPQRADIFEQTLFAQGFGCLARRDHPMIGDTLSMEQYLSADHALVVQEGQSQEVLERRINELGIKRHIVLHSPHFMSVPLLVARSDMITSVPLAVGRIYADMLGLKLLPLPFDVPPVGLKQFWHRRAHTEPANIWLRRVIAELYRDRDPTLAPQADHA